MPNLRDKERLAEVAGRQFGRVTWAQITQLGFANSTAAVWLEDGYLHRELPRVYAVGHRARTVESDLAEALLYAGPGAALSHATAAWWLGLLDRRPQTIQVTTPRRCRSINKIRVYDRRRRPRIMHKQLAVTTIPHTLIDLAATAPLRVIRRALANAEYLERLDIPAIEEASTHGLHGATKLRAALKQHLPSLALTKSRLERMLLRICEQERIPLPELGVKLDGGWEIDALWRTAKLAVELDGYGNHHTPAQLRRDRRKEMAVRAMGLTPIRYSEEQLIERTQVANELRSATA